MENIFVKTSEPGKRKNYYSTEDHEENLKEIAKLIPVLPEKDKFKYNSISKTMREGTKLIRKKLENLAKKQQSVS